MTEQELKRARSNLKIVQNQIRLDWSFKRIKTWADVHKLCASSNPDDKVVVWPELLQFLEQQKLDLEQSYEQSKVPTIKEVKAEIQAKQAQDIVSIKANECEVDSSTKKDVGHIHIESNGQTALDIYGTARQRDNIEAVKCEVLTDEQRNPANLKTVKESKSNLVYNEQDYGLFEVPTWTASHYWFQKKAIRELLTKIVGLDPAHYESFAKYKEAYDDPSVKKNPVSGVLLLSPTGTGKTFIMSAVCRILWDLLYHENRTWSHIPYLMITKSTVVGQSSRVLKTFYNLEPVGDVEVINIEMLRSNAGKMWLQKQIKIEQGEEVIDWKWKKNVHPCVAFFDESQGAKNVATQRGKGSTQGQIMCNYSDIPSNATLVSVSATPFMRVCEAKCFAISTKKDITYIMGVRSPFPEGTKLTAETWSTYANIIAYPASPFEYVQAAIERLMEDLKDYVVRVTGVKFQFKGVNSVKVIQFEDDEKRKRYERAWLTFQERKAKLDARKLAGDSAGPECMFAILLAFQMAAELEHADHIAQTMHEAVTQRKRAAVAALKQKQTIIAVVKLLITKYGWKRDDISLVWGGGQTQLNEKQKARAKVKEKEDILRAMGMSTEEILENLGLEDVEDRVIEDLPPEWRLGLQSQDDREREIRAFQSGKTKFCLYTFKAGGVGLSLHHTDEFTTKWDETVPGYAEWKKGIDEWNEKEIKAGRKPVQPGKVRRKESGFAYEEDIPFIPIRPRETCVALTYNGIELVQGVGRVPRLTSLSPTEQVVYAYAGTIEVEIGHIVSQKLRCLSSVVKMKEDWQDIIMTSGNASDKAVTMKRLMASTEGAEDDSDIIDESPDEEGEE